MQSTRYFIYARKSSESEERQVLSIESQTKELRERFGDLNIVDVLEESHSAFHTGRPVFNEMLERIGRGEADGIVAWHPDRLSRNPLDGGHIVHLLDTGAIKDLKFGTYYFDNTPEGKMMLGILFAQSKHYSDALSRNIKRGNKSKLEQGWVPGPPPQGYMNERITKTIVEDPERFPIVRKMFDEVLSGVHHPAEVLRIATNDWSYRTPIRGKLGGNPLSKSGFYDMLRNPFYYGVIERGGESYKGSHTPMITEEEFWHVQRVLRPLGRRRPKHKRFALTGLIQCGECGAWITAEEKVKVYKETKRTASYTYYRCAHRKSGVECHQRPITAQELESQVDEYLQRLEIPESFVAWILKYLKEAHDQESADQNAIYETQQKAYRDTQNQLNNLLALRLRDLISDEEFSTEKGRLQQELLALKEKLDDTDHRAKTWFELSEDTFNFCARARYWFKNGTLEDKRIILQTVGSNLALKDRKLTFEPVKPFSIVAERPENKGWWS